MLKSNVSLKCVKEQNNMMKEEIVVKVLEKCGEYFGTSEQGIKRVKEFGDGRSGNSVFLIKVLDSYETEKNGNYILKICFENADEFLNEIINTVELGNKEKNACGIFFPQYEISGKIENTLYYIYDVAGSELNATIQLSNSMTTGGSVLEKISREILMGWNEKFRNTQVSIAECIRQMVGLKRLEVGGRISERIGQLIGDVLTPTYYYEDELLPNPYYYLNNMGGPLEKK